MATVPNTLCFFGSMVTSNVASGAAQAITMPTITLPEDSKTFVSARVDLYWGSLSVLTNENVAARRIDLGLGGGAKTTYNHTRAITTSGEAMHGLGSFDVTAQFAAQWSGTSMSCQIDAFVTMASAAALNNMVAVLWVTYICDSDSATKAKTAIIPLNTSVASLGNSKPASQDTIPALDTYLAEASKSYSGAWIFVKAPILPPNITDQAIFCEVDSLGAAGTGLYETGHVTSAIVRAVFPYTASTSTTHTLHLWSTSAGYVFHPQVYLYVTYTYDEATTTTVSHSVEVPISLSSPIGTSTHPSRGTAELWVAEASPTLQRMSASIWWQATGTLLAPNWRLGTGAFVTYTDGGIAFAGSNGCMVRNDAAYSLSQGANVVEVSGYTSSGATNAGNLSAVLVVNYTAPKMPGGTGAHTRTVQSWLHDMFDGNAVASSASTRTVAGVDGQVAVTPALPDDHFIVAIGIAARVIPMAANVAGWSIAAQRDSGSGWTSLYCDTGCSDAETGAVKCVARVQDWFTRWHGDVGPDRQNAETARRWKFANSTVNAASQAVLFDAIAFTTFHLHTWTVAGNITGSSGSEVEITLNRYRYRTMSGVTGDTSSDQITTPSPHWLSVGQPVFVSSANGAGLAAGAFYTVATVVSATVFTLTGVNITSNVTSATLELPTPNGDVVRRATRTGDGAFSMTWYDATEPLFLAARDMVNGNRRVVTGAFIADSGVTHNLRLWHPPGGRVIDAAIVRKAGG